MSDTVKQEKRPRGRPRPQETIERDNMILKLLRETGPQTRNAIAEGLGVPETKVYLALDRLRKAGHVRICADTKGPGSVWMVGKTCP